MSAFYYVLMFFILLIVNATWLLLTFGFDFKEKPIRNITMLTSITAGMVLAMSLSDSNWVVAGVFAAIMLVELLIFVKYRPKQRKR